MNRVLAVAAALATAAAATVTILPAMAAPVPAAARAAARPAAGARSARAATRTAAQAATAQRAMVAVPISVQIASELDGGQYVTVVQCSGPAETPPPVTLLKPGTPLTVHGGGSSSAVLRLLKKPTAYKTVYTCRVIVKEKVPAKPKKTVKKTRPKRTTINTGFGGMAPQVGLHHPVG